MKGRMKRVQRTGIVLGEQEVAQGIHLLRLECPDIARTAEPGQFVNIKAADALWGPFLRRPFSISDVDGDVLELLFNVIGSGTKLLASKRAGDVLDLIGPLGKPFGCTDDFSTAVMVGGGLGFAPFPFLHRTITQRGRDAIVIVGARSAAQVYTGQIDHPEIATDDGSQGFHGTTVDLLRKLFRERTIDRPKVFGCGPTPMLRALSAAAQDIDVPCEISLEGDMACGIGICQGCPVETSGGSRTYALVCTDGPTFECREVNI